MYDGGTRRSSLLTDYSDSLPDVETNHHQSDLKRRILIYVLLCVVILVSAVISAVVMAVIVQKGEDFLEQFENIEKSIFTILNLKLNYLLVCSFFLIVFSANP